MTIIAKIKNTAIALAAVATLATGISTTSAHAAGYLVNTSATTFNFSPYDRLNIRAWPASSSRKVARVKLHRGVFVERCIIKSGADWCKIRKGWKYGWVNGRYLIAGGQNFASPHYLAHGWH